MTQISARNTHIRNTVLQCSPLNHSRHSTKESFFIHIILIMYAYLAEVKLNSSTFGVAVAEVEQVIY